MKATEPKKIHRRNSTPSPTRTENSAVSEKEMDETNPSEHTSQVESDNDNIPGGGKQAPGAVHLVSKKTKCWLFFDIPKKAKKKSIFFCVFILNCFVVVFKQLTMYPT